MSIEESDIALNRKIGFSFIKGINVASGTDLLERVGGIDAFYNAPTKTLWDKIGAQKSYCTDASRKALQELGASETAFVRKHNIETLFFTENDYPGRLRDCADAPVVLYKLGNCELNSRHIISIVGTRRATAYGQKFTNELVAELAERLEDIVIVSGLAYGIDVAAHKAALNSGIPTVGVVAHGLNTIYPAEHRDIATRMIKNGGAILSEYTSTSQIHKGNFLARNRIVAGIADATIIVESDEKGGAMVTASIAQAYNRDVFAAPGRNTDRYSRGPLKLIFSNRAALIRGADDLIELMNWTSKKPAAPMPELSFANVYENLSPEKTKIADYLRANQRATINDMVSSLDMPYSLLSARLMEMEMDDMVTALPGSAYTLNI